ncbi:MAG: hypothetical protein ACR2O4_17860 [Hyphomicrobiaceae bacterium]
MKKAKQIIANEERCEEARMSKPTHINAAQWDHAVGYARQSCARIFRHGGTPSDAMSSFGLAGRKQSVNWGSAVESIAMSLCAPGK